MKKLKLDPLNARRHGDRNRELIRKSLEEVGPFRSVAVDGDGVVRAGNGVYEQAQELGLKIRVVQAAADELIAVQRADLTGARAERAALLDNRTGETSAWDPARLGELARGDQLDGLFTEEELAALLKGKGDQAEAALKPLNVAPPPKMSWVLLAIPAVRFGEIAADVERLAALPGVLCETTVDDGLQKH